VAVKGGTKVELKGKTALVTGGAGGIGRATACAFAAMGASVVVVDTNLAGLKETASQIESANGKAIVIPTDITKPGDVERAVAEAVKLHGRLDFAHNNAGILGAFAPTADYPLADFHKVMEINCTGTFICLQQELAQMVKQGGGTIVNTASASGLIGYPGISGYTAAKHAVVGLTRNAAVEYAKQNIRVNAICPGVVNTPMTQGMLSAPGGLDAAAGGIPMGRVARPEEIAELVVWLCSARSSFVNGAIISIDGGYTAL
jgi:NAD(P)-dependent dehydrogenase (short-subunit alcohol dehydrogenase family)